jgi:hypothetical protein
VVAEVDGERKPQRQPRARQPRRLRDISYLYLSGRPASPGPAPVATRRRSLRVGFAGAGAGTGRADVCANMAVQLVRLGQRTLVIDLDPHLPNVGFFLGLEPGAYMGHLLSSKPRLERALLGLRLLQCAGCSPGEAFADELQAEIDASTCVLVNFPDLSRGAEAWLEELQTLLGRPRSTTMVEAAERSPMFGSWLQSARRGAPEARPREPSPALDALLFVHDHEHTEHLQGHLSRLSRWLPSSRIHLLGWGEGRMPAGLHPWAQVQPYGGDWQGVQLLSSWFPEHPAARIYQGLVQSLLAGAGSSGGAHV